MLVEWSDGRRSALLFELEEETDPKRFSIHRLAHYCLDLSELFGTERVVPVAIFLHRGTYAEQLTLGSENRQYLQFTYPSAPLFATPARDHFDSPNLVARLTLPSMAYAPEDKLAVYAAATRGLCDLEPDPERRLKYADFIDIYAELTENELQQYHQHYPKEAKQMTALSARFIEQGIQQGMQKGMQQEAVNMLGRQIQRRFGSVSDEIRQRLNSAETDQLEHWADNILDAKTLDDVFKLDSSIDG